MRSYDQYCGLALALDQVGDRWTLLVVRELLTGPKRFSDLREGLPGVATNLLTGRLRSMEASGLVERRDLPPPAASSVYALTALGAELAEPVHALIRWGGHFIRERAHGQTFRPNWLGVALQALLAAAEPPPAPLLLRIELPEGEVALELGPEGVRFAAGEGFEPQIQLSGTATGILGLAAGELDWKAARAHGVVIEGPAAAVKALRRVLAR